LTEPETRSKDTPISRNKLQNLVALVSTSEIILKSSYVRSSLLRTLLEHLRWRLRRSGFRNFQITIDSGRIVVSDLDCSYADEVCSQIFGVAAVASAFRLSGEASSLVEEVSAYVDDLLSEGNTFAVRARVVGPYSISSREIERSIGSAICSRFGEKVKVDLDLPEKTVHIEVRGKSAYLYGKRIEGCGGLPYGSQGRLIGMLSSNVNSALALWLMMKRGCHVIPVFMDMTTDDDQDGEQRAIAMARRLREFAPINDYRLLLAPFLECVEATSSVEKEYRWILCRRIMCRVACVIAEKLHALGLVTEETLEKDSPTLLNLSTIDEAARLPVHRPLIGLDRAEIQTLASRIGVSQLPTKEEEHAYVDAPLAFTELQKLRAIEQDLEVDNLVQGIVGKVRKISLE